VPNTLKYVLRVCLSIYHLNKGDIKLVEKLEAKQPLIGVFVTVKNMAMMRRQFPPERLLMIAEANLKAATELFFFSIKDVDSDEWTIDGVYYDHAEKKWRRKEYPLPEVLYNRGGSCKSKAFDALWDKCRELGVHTINWICGFDKWETYSVLRRTPLLRPHLPVTRLYQSPKDLVVMLRKYDQLYLKSCKGRKGLQVLKVTKLAGGEYEYSHYRHGLHIKNGGIYKLLKDIRSFFRGYYPGSNQTNLAG